MPDLAPELRRRLDAIEAPDLWSDIGSREPGPPRGGPSAGSRIGAALLALLVAAGGLALASRAFRSEPPPVRPASRVANGVLAFRSFEIWVVNPDGSGLRRLNRLECINDACDVAEGSLVLTPWEWSPDGTRIASYGYAYHRADSGGADYAIFVMSADGSEVTDLTSELPELEGTSQGNPHWSPDGTRLAFDNDDGIYVVNADGSGVVKVARVAFPTWSPDGTRIAFVTGSVGGGSEIHVVNADGTGEMTVTSSEGFGGLPAWSPDGSRIAYVASVKGEGQQLYVVSPDGTGETSLTDLRYDGLGGYSPTWSPDGNTIAIEVFEQGNWNIYLVPADGSGVRQLTDLPGDENRPTWAPDGTRIAFMGSSIPSSKGENSGSFDVHVIDPDGTDLQRLTDGAGAAPGALTWQPLIVSEESSTTPRPSPTNAPPVGAVEVAQSVELRFGERGGITSAIDGFGSLWVSLITNEGKEELLRVDPASGDVLHTFPLTNFPGHEWGGGGLAIGGGSVWVAGADAGIEQAVLSRIDPATNAVAEIPLEGRAVSDVAFDVQSGGLWALVAGLAEGAAQVVEIDADTGEVVSATPFEAEWYGGIFPASGTAWVLEREVEHSTVQGGALVQILPGSGRSVATGGSFAEPVTDGTSIWAPFYGDDLAMNLASGIAKIDPSTGRVVDEWKIGSIGYDIAAGEDRGIWFLGDGSLNRLNPSTREVDVSVHVRGTPIFIALSSGGLWVGTYEGHLVRFDVST